MIMRRRLAVLIAVLVVAVVAVPFVHWWRTAPMTSADGYRVLDERRLAIVKTLGENDTLEVSVQESATQVIVTVRSAHDDSLSDDVGHTYRKEVVLEAPLGDRKVVDAATHEEMPLLP